MAILVVSKRKIKRWFFVLLVFFVLLAVVVFFLQGHWQRRVQRDLFVQDVLGLPVHTVLLPEASEARPGIEREIRYVVIHETGNMSRGADAVAHSEYLLSGKSGGTSWHYTVDDRQVYHHIPDTEVAWHAGDRRVRGGGNMAGIGIELCVNTDGDFEETFRNAAKLTAYLLDSYGLSTGDIRQHADFLDKNCPETIRDNNRMAEFVALSDTFLKELRQAKQEASSEAN